MAALRNTALAVFRFTGATRIADMMKYYASNSKLAVNIIKQEVLKLNNPALNVNDLAIQ